MAVIGDPNKIGAEICNALGLENVTDIVIELHLNSIAQVTVTYFPDEDSLKTCVGVIKKYELVEKI